MINKLCSLLGNITGYVLRQIANDAEKVIYFGLRREFNVTQLESLSSYSFSLEACNNIGCTRSGIVTYQTSEMAPLSVPTPILINLNQTTIALYWAKLNNDQIINGFLVGYILYVSETQYPINSLSLNISVCLQCASFTKEIGGLIPGTEYAIVLSACTNGGCTNSSVLKLTTSESLPDVDDLEVYAINRTSSSLFLEWNSPKRPNGQPRKFILYKDDKLIYEGLENNLLLDKLDVYTFYSFFLEFCNNFGCSSTRNKTVKINTDEERPTGRISLESRATGPNEIELKWLSDSNDIFKPNGHVLFTVFVTGPFLVDFTLNEAVEMKRRGKQFTEQLTLNLLNTTVLNTKYGIIDPILPFSTYSIVVNASNSKGFVLSNVVQVETFKTKPEQLIPPQLVQSESRSMKIEWFDAILLNSDDGELFYQVEYRVKRLWTSNGLVEEPSWDSKLNSIFASDTLATTFNLSNLIPFTAYSFRLIIKNTFGSSKSEWSDEYLTKEELPTKQNPPLVVNVTSTSVYLKWNPPEHSNGKIVSHRIIVYNYDSIQKCLVLEKNITINKTNDVNYYNVESLNSFVFYLFQIESCNSIGCVSSNISTNLTLDSTFIQTLASIPDLFDDPVLESRKSYSVEVKWKAPQKPNGIIQYYILERFDYSVPLSIYIQNKTPATRTTRYQFAANKFSFFDYELLEACGLYSYRLYAVNEIGNVSTNWINITVSKSKPLIVTSPIVNIKNASVARFEWMKPITYCQIKTYTLVLKPSFSSTFIRVEVENSNFEEQSILVDTLIPFSSYGVSLIACVYLDHDACTESLTRNFLTPGASPQGLAKPKVRLVSSKSISIEWLEPLYKNGPNLNYQLIRTTIYSSILNKTEKVYAGTRNYFLDTFIKDDSIYQYKIIYSNDFGNSISEPSDLIFTESSKVDQEPIRVANNTIKLLFMLKTNCFAPNSVRLSWNTYLSNQLVNILTETFALTVDIDKVRVDFSTEVVISSQNVSINLNLSNQENSFRINTLKPFTTYTFRLNLTLKLDSLQFIIMSEAVNCTTMSVEEAFQKDFLVINSLSRNELLLSYNLSRFLLATYQRFRINLLRVLNSNKYDLINTSVLTNQAGQIRLGLIKPNWVYNLIIEACYGNITSNELKSSILEENDCIYSIPIVYSNPTSPPNNLSDLYLNSTQEGIQIEWFPPLEANDFQLSYLLYRRDFCTLESNLVECDGVRFERRANFECCGKSYLPRNGSTVCCGGKFHAKRESFECCANTYYVYVPAGQICCYSKQTEIKYTIGLGDSCCSFYPYYKNSLQICCENQLVPRYLQSFESNLTPSYELELLYPNECPKRVIHSNQTDTDSISCKEFELISNQTQLTYLDSSTLPYSLYQYRICAQNRFNRTCNSKIFMEQSRIQLPDNFDFFNYEIDDERTIYLYWNMPKKPNGPLESFRLFRNSHEIYRGLQLNFTDQNNIRPFEVYLYELKACNSIGCVNNSVVLMVSTKQKLPERFERPAIKKTNSSLEITWKYPLRPNGVIEKFVLYIKEIDLELNLNVKPNLFNANSIEISARNELTSMRVSLANMYTLLIEDLLETTLYSVELLCCNQVGCVRHSERVSTLESDSFTFRSPIAYVLNQSSIELVWYEPRSVVLYYHIVRNEEKVGVVFANQSQPSKYFNFVDRNLKTNTFYSYAIEATTNRNFTIKTRTIVVQTPPSSIELSCPIQSLMMNLNNSMNNSVLRLFNVINTNFTVNGSREILLSYDLNEWKNFISCLSRSSYKSHTFFNSEPLTDVNQKGQSDDNTIFSMKLLIQSSQQNELQTLEFPYPNQLDDRSNRIQYLISGLLPFTDYFIRISFSTSSPNRIAYTTQSIYLKTFEEKPCCDLETPSIVRQVHSRLVSVRWSSPSYPNGIVNRYRLIRAKLVGNVCTKINRVNSLTIQTTNQIDLFVSNRSTLNENFFYDETRNMFVYKDSFLMLFDGVSSFAYKVMAFNSKGEVESEWSEQLLAWQLNTPASPLNTRIVDTHATGFKLQFNRASDLNGLLSHYIIYIRDFFRDSNRRQSAFIQSENVCDNQTSLSPIEVSISGLDSYKSYRLGIVAVNQMGIKSNESVELIANTIESSPAKITMPTILTIESSPFNHSILFKFNDPIDLNGLLTTFNLYIQNQTQLLIYSGLNREFLFTNLKPFRNYSFVLEVCTYAGCTKQSESFNVLTLPSPPLNQTQPRIKGLLNNNCLNISWDLPLNPNGIIIRYELNKVKFSFLNNSREQIVQNLTTQSFVDCDIETNSEYSYQVTSFNTRGNTSSNFTAPLTFGQLLPEGIFPLTIIKLNESCVRVDWMQPRSPNGRSLNYKIFRNSTLIINQNSSVTFLSNYVNFVYFDLNDFEPNQNYSYQMTACNEIGCSSGSMSTILIKNQAPIKVSKAVLIAFAHNRAEINAGQIILKSNRTQKIIQFRYFLNKSLVYEGNESLIALKELDAFTWYSISYEACTFLYEGCLSSDEDLLFRTSQYFPSEPGPINIIDLPFNENFISVHLTWRAPLKPNGILKQLELQRDELTLLKTRNLNITSFVDTNLNYGKSYLFKLTYCNDFDCTSSNFWHTVVENLPQMLEPIKCFDSTETELYLTWSLPLLPNGKIFNYEIAYKPLSQMEHWTNILKTDLSLNSLKISELSSNTNYELKIGFCNSKGCSYSNATICKTKAKLVQTIAAPTYQEVFSINMSRPLLLLQWTDEYQEAVLEYVLYRVNVRMSIAFDVEYNVINKNFEKAELYRGKNRTYLDVDLNSANTYDYFLLVKFDQGNIISPSARFNTKPDLPEMLINAGSLKSLTNQTAFLKLNPPLRINGELRTISLLLISQDSSEELMILKSLNSQINSAEQLLEFLHNVKLEKLQPNCDYKVKSKFCNQIGCIISHDFIEFSTLQSEKLMFFYANNLSKKRVELKWKYLVIDQSENAFIK